ncbi:hypothetical protein Leryth_006757 [Lithospermum erythrorhizon]|nr:hypothetical protein Leryth_006757 [Lithospermum erythrorhizon]
MLVSKISQPSLTLIFIHVAFRLKNKSRYLSNFMCINEGMGAFERRMKIMRSDLRQKNIDQDK